ncbi:MAG: tetratricopeptide repeat protein [Proteobacteria bacterium]|nr:tetratricopeptide repeat protein [Pseudomonadota bacterium]
MNSERSECTASGKTVFPTMWRGLPYLILLAATILVYSNTLQAPFIFDDYPNIVENRFIQIYEISFESIKDAATKSPMGNRWLANLSLALNYSVDQLDTFGFHLVNIVLHICAGFALYYLAGQVMSQACFPSRRGVLEYIPFFTALLWMLHPVQTNAVTYIVQRMTSMSALFYLFAMICYIKARTHNSIKRKYAWYLGCSVSGFLAVVSKENAVMLPIILVAVDFCCLPPRDGHNGFKRFAFPVCIGIAALLFAMFCLGGDPLSSVFSGYQVRDFTPMERLLTESRVFFSYLLILLLPLPARLNLNHDYLISHGLFSPPQTAFAIAGIVLFVGLIIILYRYNRLLAFCLFWFIANLMIESTILPLEIIYEHRLYLPSMLLILMGVFLVFQLPLPPKFVSGLLIALAIVSGILTFQRNAVWQNEVGFWQDIVRKSPNLYRAHVNLGKALSDIKDNSQSEQHFRIAIALDPDKGDAFYNLGILYDRLGRTQAALPLMQTAITKVGNQAKYYQSLGMVYRKLGDCSNARIAAQTALNLNPATYEAFITLGICEQRDGNHPNAVGLFKDAHDKGLVSVDLYNNWAVSLEYFGKYEQARDYLLKALELYPEHYESRYNLGIIYSRLGMDAEAEREISRAVKDKKGN